MRLLILFAVTSLVFGCTASYKQNLLAEPDKKLISGKSVIIATPANGFYENIEYPNSGKMTADVVRASFAQHTSTILVSTDCKDIACLQNLNKDYGYLVVPEIIHWEERATEWSGKSDRIEVKITVYENQSWRELSSVVVTGKSKWATFGGDHPQELLPEPLNDYIDSLY